jgi:hypothetical protein
LLEPYRRFQFGRRDHSGGRDGVVGRCAHRRGFRSARGGTFSNPRTIQRGRQDLLLTPDDENPKQTSRLRDRERGVREKRSQD